ncbi:amino acid racemase [Amphritea sp. 2_MG-2023]|uniref:aspartate/glutamate racemase family protein n=1 Tax=Amphritea TaxID=515417 RepID=UPI001C06BBD4|nr:MULTISPECIES: amino acid racemase [Amphritea]MBU2967291.1 amino acid racemase [Amphritea atlantica]MDO6420438.1 amino acid racemase [Amphritea sp. 2_MG-2023]
MSINTGNEKVVGIIGGMGPEATVDLMRQVIAATPARDDIDHVRMLVDNNPKVPSRIKAIIEGTGESPAPCMIEMARGLENQGADFLVIPCNTAHHYYPDVAAAVNIPVLNLVKLTSESVKKAQPDLSKAGLLASSALQMIHLYEPWFEKHDVEVLYPQSDDQQVVMALIRAVKANNSTAEQIQAYNRAARNLADQGAQCLILACTELSVMSDRLETSLPVYDASKLLAQAIVREALVCE